MVLIAYGFLLEPGRILYSPHSDVLAYHLGTTTVLHRARAAGRGIPFWRSDQLSGYPALINPQSLYSYPLNFLFHLLPPADAVGGTFWLHFLVVPWVFYVVGHVLGLGLWPRLLMAAAGLFNFKMVAAAYAGWLPMMPGITLFPLLFAAVFHLAKRPGLRSMLWLAGTGALCLHTGHPQLVYYACCFLTLYVAALAVRWWRERRRQELRRAGTYLLCGGLLAVGMAAYLLVPLAADAPLLTRGQPSYEFFAAFHSLAPRHLLTFFHPEALGSPLDGSYPGFELWEDVAYFGIVPLLLAIVGAVLGRQRPVVRFLALSFLISLLLAMKTPLLRVTFSLIPGFRLFRHPSRLLFVTAFFGIALAGIGLDEILKRLRPQPRGELMSLTLVGLLIGFVCVEGLLSVQRYLTTVPQEQVLPVTDYEKFFAADRTPFRVASAVRNTINYGSAARKGLQLITGYDAYCFRHYRLYFELLQRGKIAHEAVPAVWLDLVGVSRWDLLAALNVKYLVMQDPRGFSHPEFRLAAHWKDQPTFVFYEGMKRRDIYVYRNEHSLPRAFWVENVVGAEDERHMIALMKEHNLRRTAIVQGLGQTPRRSSASAADHVGVKEARPGHLALHVECQAPRFLVISEVWHPGWRAFMDGQKLQLHRTDLALMGLWVPSGRHELVLRFRPLYWSLGLGISAASGALFLLLLLRLFQRRGGQLLRNCHTETPQEDQYLSSLQSSE